MKDITTVLAELASSNGDAPAIIDAEGELNYADFDNWTNAIAHGLNEMAGAEPKVCLVVAGLDIRAFVGMFAVYKTPHIFLALDREIPPANLAEIAREMDAGACLYTAGAEETVREAALSLPMLKIDTPPEGTVAPVEPILDLDRVALMKRTSGSTGKAKTVALLAKSVLIDVLHGAKILDIQKGSKLAVVSTFDAALTCTATLRTIISGATLMPVDLRFETPKQATARLIEKKLTHIYCTPTAVRVLARGLSKGEIYPDLRSILLGGEKTTMADVRLMAKSTPPDAKLRATFASTETQLVGHTTVDLGREVGLEDFSELDLAEGVKIEILDEEGKPKPAGEIGRVRIVSEMISLGYIGDVDPALAAKHHQFEDGTRSYLTDDLGYLTPEGRLVLTSRTGREVKIRARRVDLTELENWLTSQPGISEAAVVAQPIGPDESLRLVAFVDGVKDEFEGTAALRAKMQAELVAAMVPTAIVEVDDLPRTPSQKIDRRTLETDLSHLEASDGEQMEAEGALGDLAKIWQKILNRNVSGPDAHFFNLGGDSISATVAALQIEEQFGVTVDTGFVYRYPILSDQAYELENTKDGAAPLPDRLIVPLTTQSMDHVTSDSGPPRVFVISGAGGHVFPFAPLAHEMLPDWDLVGLLHPNILDSEPELGSVEAYAERMAKAIKALQPAGPYYIMGYSFGGAVAHEIGRMFSENGEKVAVKIVDLPLASLEPPLRRANKVRRRLKERFRQGWAADPDADLVDNLGILDDPDLDDAERGRLKASFKRMNVLLDEYRPKASTAPTVLIKAEMTPERFDAHDYGWRKVAPLKRVVVLPGNHVNLFKGEYLSGFAETARENLRLLAAEI